MSTVQTVKGINKVVGPLGFDLYSLRFDVGVDGSYNTGARPNFDILAAVQAHMSQGISAVAVKAATLLQDGTDGTNRYTVDNATTALSGTGNKVVTFRINSGATNGDTGTELTTETVHHTFSFIVTLGITGYLS